MDKSIKQAFFKVKQDIFYLGEEIQSIKLELLDLKTEFKLISSFIEDLKLKTFLREDYAKEIIGVLAPTHNQEKPTIPTHIPTHPETPTDNLPYKALKSYNMPFSTGNQGVPTDRQTNQQTDQHIIQQIKMPEKTQEISKTIDHLAKIDEILSSLDALKKELRLKIKRLTSQEMSVFSLLYSLEQQGELVSYPLLSSKLKLSESSIRDYILKIQKKGIPITKEKLNNKQVILHISQDLKKIASLDTIIKLREL